MPVRHSHLGDHLSRTVKVMQAVRQRAGLVTAGVEPTAFPVLFQLEARARRVSDVAGSIHSDTSTVSRQATALVAAGLVDKTRDPDDGRVQLLRITDQGRSVLSTLRGRRDSWLESVLHDWTDEEITEFAGYLARFVEQVGAELGSAAPPAHPPPSTSDPSSGRSSAPTQSPPTPSVPPADPSPEDAA